MTPQQSKTTALITGASAGIGAEFARQLAGQGHNLVLVARDRGRLEKAAADLEQQYGITAEVLPADLTDDGGVAAVVGRLTDSARPVDILVNNAGRGLLGDFEQNAISDELQGLVLHCQVPMELTHAALPGMLARGSGRIINVASIAAFIPRGTYAADKAWLLSFSRWTNHAYGKRGVKITAVCPGLTHTEFHERMGMDKSATPSLLWLTAGRVVREGLADNARGKAVSVPSKRYKALAVVSPLLPGRLLTRSAPRLK